MGNNFIISLENVSKSYGSLKAVDGLNLQVQKGEILGLLGPNGAGKTTAINMICNLLKPDSGKIEFLNGVRNIGVCPQEIVLWEYLTCEEQLIFQAQMYNVGRKAAKKNAEYLLTELGLSDKKKSLSKELSGGMKRRLNIALAMVHDPDIIILDEPELLSLYGPSEFRL